MLDHEYQGTLSFEHDPLGRGCFDLLANDNDCYTRERKIVQFGVA